MIGKSTPKSLIFLIMGMYISIVSILKINKILVNYSFSLFTGPFGNSLEPSNPIALRSFILTKLDLISLLDSKKLK
jgi:hypothetical protein